MSARNQEIEVKNLTINGQALQAEDGTVILEAARSIGIFIPHYCYHPKLSIAGCCRMCLVEIQGQPKLYQMEGPDKLRIKLDLPDAASRLSAARGLLAMLDRG